MIINFFVAAFISTIIIRLTDDYQVIESVEFENVNWMRDGF